MLKKQLLDTHLCSIVTMNVIKMKNIIAATLFCMPVWGAAQAFTKNEITRFKTEAQAVTIIRDN